MSTPTVPSTPVPGQRPHRPQSPHQYHLQETALPDVSELDLPDSPIGRMISRAYTEQAVLGWNMACRGFLSQHWKAAQAIHSASTKRVGSDSITWMASVVSWCFALFEKVWSQRNLEEFGKNQDDVKQKKLVLCERAIRRLFIAGQELPPHEQHPIR